MNRQPTEKRITVNNFSLTVYEWGKPTKGKPSVIFFHATGFHARCWDAVIRQLPDVHCYAMDARGHGSSDKPTPPHTWQQMGADAIEMVKALNLKDAVGVGHSMGGNMLTRAAAQVPEAFKSLLLIEPVIFPQELYTLTDYRIDGHFVLNRKREWHSVEEMVERFKGRGPFSNWQDEVLRDYCQYGILPDGDTYQLACSPEVEAHIYTSALLSTNADIYNAVDQITHPVVILRADTGIATGPNDLVSSPTAPDLDTYFENAQTVLLAEYGHFIPMESPQMVADHVRKLT